MLAQLREMMLFMTTVMTMVITMMDVSVCIPYTRCGVVSISKQWHRA